MGIAVGSFTGGGLRYYPNDDKKGDLTLLRKKSSVVLDLKRKPTVFDGNRGHNVEPFKGERFSLIFFSVKGFSPMGAQLHFLTWAQASRFWNLLSTQPNEMVP